MLEYLHIGRLAALAGVALITAPLSKLFFPGSSFYNVCLGLFVLWLLFVVVPDVGFRAFGPERYVGAPLWVLGLSGATAFVAVTTASAGVEDPSWIMPAATPILISMRRTALLPPSSRDLPQLVRSVWLQIATGTTTVLLFIPAYNIGNIALSSLALLFLVTIYASMIRGFERDGHTPPTYALPGSSVPIEVGSTARTIRIATYVTLTIVAIMSIAFFVRCLQFPVPLLTTALLAGFAICAHYYAVISVVQEAPWEIAATLWTYAVAAHNAFNPGHSAPLGALQSPLSLTVAILAVYQTISFLPRTTRGRHLLLVFAIWPGISLFHSSRSGIPFIPFQGEHGSLPSSLHPIEHLISKGRAYFTSIIDRQSKTLEAAQTEYRRRYLRNPPPGFDKWFAYAQAHQSMLIDEFDMIHEDLKPFWKVSPKRLLESIDHVTSFDHLALRKCGFTDGKYYGQGGGWIVDDLGHLLEEVARDIPNVEFAFDVVDEPRVIISQEILEAGGVPKPEFQDEKHKSIWKRVTAPCQHDLPKPSKPTVHDYGIPFVQDWYAAKDVCQHPEFELMYGFFSSPTTCLLTGAPIPVLSQAAPTSFGDIMYPSPWYTAKKDQGTYKEEDDPPWEQKAGTLYWAGSTTGSYSTNGSWVHSHRQRFVKLVQTLNETNYKYLREATPGVWKSHEAVEDHSDLFDVKLTAVIQCDDKDCEEQKKFFLLGEKEERNKQFHSRFVFDTDGNSFSGRYYTLLQSRSVVLKQTVLKEWHDERLIPWVHYIPVSISMEELPEIMHYMTSSEEGRKRAKEIADAGREWHSKVLRREDFTIYLYRLMLELARIMHPNRQVE